MSAEFWEIFDIRDNQQSAHHFRNEWASERKWQLWPILDGKGWKAVAMVTTVD